MLRRGADDDFTRIRRACKGQLKPDVYRAIYDAARLAPAGQFVEIGTAHGAATITLGRAIKDGGGHNRVHTFGRPGTGRECVPADVLHKSFAAFDVDDVVTIYIADAAEAPRLLPDMKIGLLLLDADGRIERDFSNLYDRILPGAPIIIDDFADRVAIKVRSYGYEIGIDLKMKVTYALAHYFRDCGYIDSFSVVNQTLICRKTVGTPEFHVDNKRVLDCYALVLHNWQPLDWTTIRRLIFSARDMIFGKRH